MVNAPLTPIVEPGAVITHGPAEYTIGTQLDSGGFGTVYLAKRTKPSPMDVVVKVPAGHVLTNPVFSEKFEREAQILANITHANVVKIVAFWRFPNGEMALVQELVSNARKLPAHLAAHPDTAPSVLVQALYAVRAFHPGAVHRDISPSNILIDDTGTVKVIDFGLAKEDPRVNKVLTMTGTWFGTPGCMSPEQMDDAKRVDQRADLYGLGRSMTAALQSLNPQFADPSALPEPWKSICMRLTRLNPDERYQCADDAIHDALTKFNAAGMVLTEFDVHVAEMGDAMSLFSNKVVPPSWPAACDLYFSRLQDIDQATIEIAARLNLTAFGPGFNANLFFDRLEAGSAIQAFKNRMVSFDECDPVGDLYSKLYTALDPQRRLACFKRLCKIAVGWHRFSVMADVRRVYELEGSPQMQMQLLQILDQEDPAPHDINGRGVIPGRDP